MVKKADRQVDGSGLDSEDGRGIGKRGKGTGRVSDHTAEDRIEREVRRRVADVLSSAGVNSGRIAMEVLYWLPEDFCRLYMDLTLKALVVDTGVKSPTGAAAGDEGQIKAKVGTGPTRGTGAGGLHTRTSGAHAHGGGKRYRGGSMVVKDEAAFKLKGRVDRKLRELGALIQNGERDGRARVAQKGLVAGEVVDELKDAVGDAEPPTSTPLLVDPDAAKLMEEIQGDNLGGSRILRIITGGRKQCRTCGKIASRDWVICPHPHT